MSGRERRLDAIAGRLGKLSVPQAIEDRFGKYRADPMGFCVDVLGAESATRRSNGAMDQLDVLQDLVSEPRVAVRSGHGVGKTTIDAWAGLWWLCTRPLSRVVVLAPEYARQIRAVLFSEIRKWSRRARRSLPVTVLANRVLVEGFGEEWSATGMSAAGDPDRLEGFHAEGGVLVVCDEMKGIPQSAFDAVQGALSGLEDARSLVTSVPGGAGSGPFWKACQDSRRWKVHHVSSTDSSLVSPQWVEDRARDWGVGSPLYQTRVLGEFADSGEGVLFPLPMLEAAIEREVAVPDDAATALGVDVARSVAGDFNAIAACRGGRLDLVTVFREPDTMRTVTRVLNEVSTRDARRTWVDVGGPGGGVADRLQQLGRSVEAVHFGGGAMDTARFKNRRAELFWNLRERMERAEISLPDDEELIADLSALRFDFDQTGRIYLESKDEVRKRLGRSPDRGDAVALAFAGAADGVGSPLAWLGGRCVNLLTGEVVRTGDDW